MTDLSDRSVKVTFLTRPGCHLCEEALAELREYVARRVGESPGIEVDLRDIESDDELHRRYLERIPVVMIGDEVVSEFSFESEAFQAALDRRQGKDVPGRVR